MDIHKQVLCDMKRVLVGLLGKSIESIDADISKPVYTFFGMPSAIDCLYFLLEVAIRYQIPLHNDLIEHCMDWNLIQYADRVSELQAIQQCAKPQSLLNQGNESMEG